LVISLVSHRPLVPHDYLSRVNHPSLVIHFSFITNEPSSISDSHKNIIYTKECIRVSKSQFDKMKVNLWVSGTTDNEHNGGWCSHLHCCIEGNHYTKTIGGYGKGTTPTRMTLQAILNGLQVLKRDTPVFVNVYTSVVQVSSGLNRNMHKWAKNGWLTTKGEPPQHLDLWQQIHHILHDQSRVMTYRVHLQNQTTNDQPHRLVAIHSSAEYLMKGKKDIYEVGMT
jgi:ribonuclease HI